jgi:hypothetical protein
VERFGNEDPRVPRCACKLRQAQPLDLGGIPGLREAYHDATHWCVGGLV